MILTGAMNRPGGVWFHPGFNLQFDSFELPVLDPDIIFGPGPPSRPDAQAFLGEWPCAALPDEIAAGNIRAFLNLGGSLLTSFPDVSVLEPALRELDVLVSTDIIANPTTALSTHVLPTKDQLERADVTLWDFLVAERVRAAHRAGGRAGRRPSVRLVGPGRDRPPAGPRPGRSRRQRRGDAGQGHGHSALQLRRRRRDRVRRGAVRATGRVGGGAPRRAPAGGGWRRTCWSTNWPR